MENQRVNISQERYEAVSMSKTFVANVFTWMAAALAISGMVAYLFGTDASYMSLLINQFGKPTGLGYFVMIAPLGFVLIMSFAFNRLSSMALLGLFLTYALIMGMSLSFIFLIYTAGSIAQTFAVSAGMFGFMAVVGYTTNTDLTKFGSILFMALIGIIVASIINMFMGSSTMEFVISILGVLIFTGLTAYDVQKLKRIGSGVEYGIEATNKLAIMGALTLYLDFVNLFLFMLRFLGNRRS